jgi:tetratricopeptide (TPR) repeat protein
MKLLLAALFACYSVALLSQDKPLKTHQLYDRAEAAYDQGDYKKTIEYLDQCLLLDPGYSEAYFMRGGAREQLKDFKGALTDYSIFLERRVDHREGLFNRGFVRYQLKLYDLAREDFKRLLTLPPGETNTLYFNRSANVNSRNPVMTAQSRTNPLIFNYLGMIELKQKRYSEAIAWLDSAIRLDEKDPDYFVNRALAKQQLSDTTGALADYKHALKLNPQHTLALHNLAVFQRSGEHPVDRAIESDSSILYPFLERAQLRLQQGDNKGALADFTKALELEDKDPEIWFSRGLVRERLQDFTGAFSDYTQTIELKEDHFKGWINRANVLLKMQRYKDAVDDYTVALVYHPDFAAAYYNRAIAKNYLKDLSGACEDLKKAAALGMKVEEKIREQLCKKE